MENNVCVGAVIYVPYFAKMYVAGRGAGSYLKGGDCARCGGRLYLRADCLRLETIAALRRQSRAAARGRLAFAPDPPRRTSISRSCAAAGPIWRWSSRAAPTSSGLLAEGTVDYYVRTSPTYEWDTAAGELILSEAGGQTRSLPEGRELRYNEGGPSTTPGSSAGRSAAGSDSARMRRRARSGAVEAGMPGRKSWLRLNWGQLPGEGEVGRCVSVGRSEGGIAVANEAEGVCCR